MSDENVPYTDAALSMARCFYAAQRSKQGDWIVSSLLRRADIFSQRRIVLAPLLCLSGYLLIIVAVLKKG